MKSIKKEKVLWIVIIILLILLIATNTTIKKRDDVKSRTETYIGEFKGYEICDYMLSLRGLSKEHPEFPDDYIYDCWKEYKEDIPKGEK